MLFKTTAILLQYAELTTINFTSVTPTIRLVEQQHIAPALGNVLYKSLNDAYTSATSESTLSDTQKALLEKCRCVIGPMLCYYYTPKAEVKLSDAGAQRVESATNKTAYQNQVINFREQNLREGELATELLLQFLNENKADYPDWTDSPGYVQYKNLFIKSGSEFNDLFPSHSPYRNYMAMRGKMLDVEQISIRKLLGDLLFSELKTKDQAGTAFTENESDLLFKIKKVIAYLTVSGAVPFLNVRMDANGITVMNVNTAQNDDMAKRATADKNVINGVIESCDNAAKTWIENIKEFLAAHTEDFAEYFPTSSPLSGEGRGEDCNEDRSSCNEGRIGSFGLI